MQKLGFKFMIGTIWETLIWRLHNQFVKHDTMTMQILVLGNVLLASSPEQPKCWKMAANFWCMDPLPSTVFSSLKATSILISLWSWTILSGAFEISAIWYRCHWRFYSCMRFQWSTGIQLKERNKVFCSSPWASTGDQWVHSLDHFSSSEMKKEEIWQ